MSRRLAGDSEAGAISTANAGCGLPARDWMRIRLEGDTVLSLPVSGGASALKNRPSLSWTLAPEALRDRKKFHATLATLYGRTPFFPFLADTLLPEIGSPDLPAGEFCTEAFQKALDILLPRGMETLEGFGKKIAERDHTLSLVSGEAGRAFHPSLSILDSLFRLGPDTIFALLPTF